MLRLAVIGDINIEIHGQLAVPFTDLTDNHLEYGALNMAVGGTAANFALAAVGQSHSVSILGSVGTDHLGSLAASQLSQPGMDARLRRDSGLPTGLAVCLWDTADHGGRRLSVLRGDNANRLLDSAYIEAHRQCLADASFLMVDGYCLLREPRRSATLLAMRIAAAASTKVAIDVLPHHCYSLINRTELDRWLEHADIIITEVRTIRPFLGLGHAGGVIELPLARSTAEEMSRLMPEKSFMLRFGIKNIGQSLIWRPGQQPVDHYTGFEKDGKPAFGDRLTLDELCRYFASAPERP